MRWRLLFLVVACSKPAPPPLSNRASLPVRHACSAELVERFTAALRARWRVATLDVRCVAGRFGGDGFFLAATNEDLYRTGVVDASGAELVPFIDEPRIEPSTFVNGYLAVDLDGDGGDEIIESWRRNAYEGLAADRWLVIRRIANGKFSSRMGPYLSRHHPDLGGCESTWELRGRSILVAVKLLPGIPPTGCLPEGKHRFALRGGELRR